LPHGPPAIGQPDVGGARVSSLTNRSLVWTSAHLLCAQMSLWHPGASTNCYRSEPVSSDLRPCDIRQPDVVGLGSIPFPSQGLSTEARPHRRAPFYFRAPMAAAPSVHPSCHFRIHPVRRAWRPGRREALCLKNHNGAIWRVARRFHARSFGI